MVVSANNVGTNVRVHSALPISTDLAKIITDIEEAAGQFGVGISYLVGLDNGKASVTFFSKVKPGQPTLEILSNIDGGEERVTGKTTSNSGFQRTAVGPEAAATLGRYWLNHLSQPN